MLRIVPLLIALLAPAHPAKWHLRGTLSEACTCAVPCSCNFGEASTPREYCWFVVAYTIKDGEYDGVKLDGLRFGAASGQGGRILYLDERAKPEQRAALQKAARTALRGGAGPDDLGPPERNRWKAMVWAKIGHEVGERGCSIDLGGLGGFKADYIFGRDPTRPLVVENNTTWAIERAIKGKTQYLRYKDAHGNNLDYKATNSNCGDFNYDETSKL